ncbi:MAG: ribbon-helix-helix protein, CopG family [Halobacteriaceae archaeon]
MPASPDSVRLPDELDRKLDVAARVTGTDRADLVADALEAALAEFEADDAFRERVLQLYLRDEIDADAFEAFVDDHEARVVRASKPLIHHGDELVDELVAG